MNYTVLFVVACALMCLSEARPGRRGPPRGNKSGEQKLDHDVKENKTCEEKFTECKTACEAAPDKCAECDNRNTICNQMQTCRDMKSVCIDCYTDNTCEVEQQQQCDVCKALHAKKSGEHKNEQDQDVEDKMTCEEKFAECEANCTAEPGTCACDSKQTTCEQMQTCRDIKLFCLACDADKDCEVLQQQQCDTCKALRTDSNGEKKGRKGKDGGRKGRKGDSDSSDSDES